jgi:hypothetical protein
LFFTTEILDTHDILNLREGLFKSLLSARLGTESGDKLRRCGKK